ncbi:MAG: hypothetical protein OXF42_00455 [Candidatus Dadabacteria bacterium]|nr:hypothetical protein [Candidatus Dadabacteria bacterium]MCY4046572.1 hypothetical protein [Candidatus Dadabacteria bacterium]
MFRVIYFAVFALLLGTAADARATTKPLSNAQESGVKVCAQAIQRESEIFLKDKPHESHDFVSPEEREIDKRPFFSMSFSGYPDVGISHINITATPSQVGRRKTKCDVHVTETFLSPTTCQEWSRNLSAAQGFEVLPLARDIVLLQNRGEASIFTQYYLTEAVDNRGCLVTRRRTAYER